ncbi:MAG: hypothetical protein GQ583_07510 [Methyloprofundus sp.]|nr:hypothetical protein [Methyloprofundus sp.]
MNLNQQEPATKTDQMQAEQAMHKKNNLPFLIESKAINEWLGKIASKQPIQAANEIYIVLKILAKHKDEYRKHLTTILPLIAPASIQLSQHLECLFYTSEKKLDEKKRKIARLSINTLRYLAILYQSLSLSIDSNTQLATYYNNCLQVSHLCLKQSALIYERPSSELWKIIGKIYQLASEKNILNFQIKDLVVTYKKQNCITENIKAILLFNLCKPYYLKQADILRLSELLEQHNDKLILYNKKSSHCLHSWNYNSSHVVQAINPGTDIGFSTLFLDTHVLVPLLMAEDFYSIAELLTANQSQIPRLVQAEPLRKKISTGFTNIISIIEQLRQNEKINKTSVHTISFIDKLELQPVDSQKTVEDTPTENTFQHENTPCLTLEATVKEKTDLDFVLIELASFSCNTEDLVIILDEEEKPQLGIIRNISPLKNNHQRMLTEKLSSKVSVVTLITQKSENKALLCKIPDNPSFLLLTPHKYTTGSNIHIENKSFSITRLFEMTRYFMLYQIQITD